MWALWWWWWSWRSVCRAGRAQHNTTFVVTSETHPKPNQTKPNDSKQQQQPNHVWEMNNTCSFYGVISTLRWLNLSNSRSNTDGWIGWIPKILVSNRCTLEYFCAVILVCLFIIVHGLTGDKGNCTVKKDRLFSGGG